MAKPRQYKYFDLITRSRRVIWAGFGVLIFGPLIEYVVTSPDHFDKNTDPFTLST